MIVDINAIKIEDHRKELLKEEFESPYFVQIKEFLLKEQNNGHIVFPK